jgi:hypothetical protein
MKLQSVSVRISPGWRAGPTIAARHLARHSVGTLGINPVRVSGSLSRAHLEHTAAVEALAGTHEAAAAADERVARDQARRSGDPHRPGRRCCV